MSEIKTVLHALSRSHKTIYHIYSAPIWKRTIRLVCVWSMSRHLYFCIRTVRLSRSWLCYWNEVTVRSIWILQDWSYFCVFILNLALARCVRILKSGKVAQQCRYLRIKGDHIRICKISSESEAGFLAFCIDLLADTSLRGASKEAIQDAI